MLALPLGRSVLHNSLELGDRRSAFGPGDTPVQSSGRRRSCGGVALLALLALLVLASSASAAGSIAFIRQGNIWIANPDGSGATQLTTDGAGATTYTSVSAAKGAPLLAYLHGGAPGTIGADGTGNHQLPFPNREPRGSASIHIDSAGQRLTWVTNESGSTYGVGLNSDGSSPVIFGTGGVFNTTWDDNQGTALYSSYDYNCPAGAHHNHLTIETPKADDGSNSPNPGTYICSPGLSFYYPDVSPDLQQVAVTADTDSAFIGDATNQIMVVANAAATSGGTAITPSGLGAVKPNWSPDGTTIAFQGTGPTIWTVPATGGTPAKILDDAASPAWTPFAPSPPGGGGTTGGGGGTTGGGGGTTGGGGGTTGGGGGTTRGGGNTHACRASTTKPGATCLAKRGYQRALTRCASKHGSARAACRKHAKLAYRKALALANCLAIRGHKQHARCVAHARALKA
jgi:hypothetical protein